MARLGFPLKILVTRWATHARLGNTAPFIDAKGHFALVVSEEVGEFAFGLKATPLTSSVCVGQAGWDLCSDSRMRRMPMAAAGLR
jgi:hypothetical protein